MNDDAWRRSIELNRAHHPTYAKPPPWFVGGSKSVMIGVLTIVTVLIGLQIATTVKLAEEWYRWWRAPIPTVLPRMLPAASRPPMVIGSPGDWFPADSYPAAARRAGRQGRVSVALLIGADGVPKACEVTLSSGTQSLDETTCRLAVRHGRFQPAIDSRGDPVEARFAMRGVRWVLEGEDEQDNPRTIGTRTVPPSSN